MSITTLLGCQRSLADEGTQAYQEAPESLQGFRGGYRLSAIVWTGEDGAQQPSGAFWDHERHEKCTFQPIPNSNDVRCMPSMWAIKDVETFVSPTCEGEMAGPSSFGNRSYVLSGTDLLVREVSKPVAAAYAFNEYGECVEASSDTKDGWYQWNPVSLDVFVKAVESKSEE